MAAIGGLRLVAGLAFMGAISGVCVWLLTRLFPQAAKDPSPPDGIDHKRRVTTEIPIEALEERYARGELSKADYDQMRHDLEEQQVEMEARR